MKKVGHNGEILGNNVYGILYNTVGDCIILCTCTNESLIVKGPSSSVTLCQPTVNEPTEVLLTFKVNTDYQDNQVNSLST